MSNLTSLFRVVDRAEAADISAKKEFRTTAGSLEAKQFWLTMTDAERFWRLVERVDPKPREIIEVRVRPATAADIPDIVLDSRPAKSGDRTELARFNANIVVFGGRGP